MNPTSTALVLGFAALLTAGVFLFNPGAFSNNIIESPSKLKSASSVNDSKDKLPEVDYRGQDPNFEWVGQYIDPFQKKILRLDANGKAFFFNAVYNTRKAEVLSNTPLAEGEWVARDDQLNLVFDKLRYALHKDLGLTLDSKNLKALTGGLIAAAGFAKRPDPHSGKFYYRFIPYCLLMNDLSLGKYSSGK